MKKILASLILVIALSSFKASANDVTVSSAVVASFQSSFKSATEVNWSVSGNLFKANFSLNGQYITAYYDAKAELVALTRNLSSVQLPVGLQASLKKNYSDLWITDLFEVSNEEGTAYYITIEDADSKLVLKSNGSEWSTFQKQRKS